jgi:hypothetical protein
MRGISYEVANPGGGLASQRIQPATADGQYRPPALPYRRELWAASEPE